jgi:hypothetical protein
MEAEELAIRDCFVIKNPRLLNQTQVHECLGRHQYYLNAFLGTRIVTVVDDEVVNLREIFLKKCTWRARESVKNVFMVFAVKLLERYSNAKYC